MKTNAPKGATHYSPRDKAFYKLDTGNFYYAESGYPHLPVAITPAWVDQLVSVDRAPAWDGEGLPPVGVECEVESYQAGRPDWKPCRVIAHDGDAAVINYKNNYSAHGAESFRPIKTPEQLAAEQRERAVRGMIDACGWMLSYPCACQLYDAGYRKHDQ